MKRIKTMRILACLALLLFGSVHALAQGDVFPEQDTFTIEYGAKVEITNDEVVVGYVGAIEQDYNEALAKGDPFNYRKIKIVMDGVNELDWQEMFLLNQIGSGRGYTVEFDHLQTQFIAPLAFYANSNILGVTGLTNITDIGDSAFQNCALLTALELPKATSIGANAFEGCVSLSALQLGEVGTVGARAFSNCDALTSLSLGQNVTIGDGAFMNCTNLTDLDDAAVSLVAGEQGAFNGCTSLAGIRIAEGSELPGNAFIGCTALSSVSMGDNMALPARLFSGARGIAALVMGDNATVEAGAFEGRAALKTVTLGQDSSVGADAFSGCGKLTKVALGAGCSLGARAFAGCGGLQLLSGKLLGVGEAAFQDCESLTAVELRADGTAVGASAFSGCVLLAEVSGKVRQAATHAFDGCRALKTVSLVDGAKVDSYAFQDCVALETVTGRLGAVGRGGFSGCTRLRSLSWPAVNSYGIDAFMACALDFTKSTPVGLSLSNATRQVPYILFTLKAETVKVEKGDAFDVAAAYALTTASGTPYSALRTPPHYWLDTAFMGDSDHSPKVTLSGTFDTSKVGSYPLKVSIPATQYASAHELPFTLEVVESKEDEGDDSEESALVEHSWFIPAEFTATLGFSYALVDGDAGKLTLTSGMKSVCRIENDGTLKPVAAGAATITAVDASGVTRKCKVKVVANRYAKAKPHKGEADQLTTSTKRLYYQNGKLFMELFIVNRTNKSVKNVRGAKLQLWDEHTGQLLYERSLGTILKTKLPNKGSRVYTANVVQVLVNGGRKLDLGHGDVKARLVFAG